MLLKTLLATLLLFSFLTFAHAQNCMPPAIVANNNSNNLFSPEQEMILGELVFQSMSSEVRLVRDEKLLSYLNNIGDKLIQHLPNTGLKFQFHLMDIPDVNAYNISGGHVFISRKLIAFAQSEDEVAGVLAHELGHATVHHGALDISEAFRKILNINKLGDRKDVAEKYNLLIENARTKSFSRKSGHEDVQQIEADKIGLFAMVAAGYDPNAFTSFFDRLAETEGKTGSWWSDVFGKARPDQKRLREMIQLTQNLPANCRERKASLTEGFQQWQADVVSFRETNRQEKLPALLWKKELGSKLRSDIWNFSFSRDGKMLIAQDDFSITVIRREPMETLFQIPAENADEALFSPDNKSIIFVDNNLRFEKWDINQQKPLEIKELVLRRDCWESKLSPDGNFLACVDTSTKINIIDTRTGKRVFEKKDFYPLNYYEYITWLDRTGGEEDNGVSFFRIEYSPDSRNVMFSRSNRFRFRFKIDAMTVGESENTALAVDLNTFKPIEVRGDLKKIAANAYLFLDSERVVGMPNRKVEDSGVFAFPSGKRLSKFTFSAQEVKRTSNPNYIIVKPLANAKLGVFDVNKGEVVTGMNKEDLTFLDNLMVFESAAGKIQFREVSYNEQEKNLASKEVGSLETPIASIGNLKATQISDDFKWLILSSTTRGGLWNLATGERKLLVRGFRSGIVANDGMAIADFPKLNETPHSLVFLNSTDNTLKPIFELPEKGARQYGRFILSRKSLSAKEPKKKTEGQPSTDDDDSSDLKQNVKFELSDIIQNKVIWSQDFPKNAPRYSFDEYSGRLIFYWELGSEIGKAKLKANAELKSKAEKLGNKDDDYLVEVIDAYAQKTIGTVFLETGKGSFDVYKGKSEGDLLMLYDSEGRVLIYSMKEGSLKHRFIGKFASISPLSNYIVIENFPGEISLYDLSNGDLQTRFEIRGKAIFIQFNLKGDRLFVLSDSQNAYTFDLTKFAVKPK